MLILEQKVNELLWKQYLLYQIENKKYKIYHPQTRTEEIIYRLILELTYEQIPDYNVVAIIEYLSILEKLIQQDNLTNKDRRKVENLMDKLKNIDQYYIVNKKFYPQITITKKEIFRFYYHPFFNMNSKYIRNLYSKFDFVDKNQYDVYEFDMNGALVRTFFYHLFIKYKDERFKSIGQIEEDIYDFLYKNFFGKNKEFNRGKFKKDLVSLITGKKKVLQLFVEKYDTNSRFSRFFITESLKVNLHDLTLKMCLIILADLKKSKILNLPFFNYDGGLIIIKKGQRLELPNFYRLLKL